MSLARCNQLGWDVFAFHVLRMRSVCCLGFHQKVVNADTMCFMPMHVVTL